MAVRFQAVRFRGGLETRARHTTLPYLALNGSNHHYV